MILTTKNSDQTRQRGHTLYLYSPYLSHEYLVLPSLLPCFYLEYYLSRQLLKQPFLVYVLFSFHPISPVSHIASTLWCSSDLLLDLVLVSVPVPIYATALVSVPAPAPVPILRSSSDHHPRPRSHLAFLCSPPPPFSFPLHVPIPAPDSCPAPDPVRSFPSLGPGYPLGAMRAYRHWALRTDLSGGRKRHPLPAEMMTRGALT